MFVVVCCGSLLSIHLVSLLDSGCPCFFGPFLDHDSRSKHTPLPCHFLHLSATSSTCAATLYAATCCCCSQNATWPATWTWKTRGTGRRFCRDCLGCGSGWKGSRQRDPRDASQDIATPSPGSRPTEGGSSCNLWRPSPPGPLHQNSQPPPPNPVLEIECIPNLVIIVSDCIPGFRSVYHMCIPTFSSFIVLRAQFPSPSFPCGSSPDTMKQLSLKPHLTAPSAKDDDSSSSSGSPAPFFMVCMYHMCIPGF